MDFRFREEEESAAELARKILEDHASNDRQKELEASGDPFDAVLWGALADANLTGTAIPEAYGGSDLGFLALCRLLQEVGRSVARVPAFAALVLGGLPLARFGTEAQRREWLPAIARGERIVTAALVEPGASDPLAPTTRAELRGGELRLTGVKTQVPYAAQSSQILVPAVCDDRQIAVFLVDPAADGVRVGPQRTPDGLAHAQLELAAAPAVGRLAADGREGAEILGWLVERAIAARCMMQLGVTERALEMTAEYSRQRVQFDRPIGSFQAVHQRAADAYIHVEAIRLSAWEAAWRLSCELPARDETAVAKFWASEGGHAASTAWQHLHGGIGVDMDYPLHRYFGWATQIEHELGSARQQLDRLGRAIATCGIPER